MKNRTNPNKITQIISISNNYLNHRKNLQKIRGLVEHQNPSRNKDISDFLSRQNHYRDVIKSQHQTNLQNQNDKFVSRLQNIRHHSSSRNSLRNTQSIKKTLSSQSLLSSRTRYNDLKNKQIKEQNQKMKKRISSSRNKDRLGPQSFLKTNRESKQFKQVVGRYSERSKSQMKSMLDNLHMDAKKVPFLPYVNNSRKKSRNGYIF